MQNRHLTSDSDILRRILQTTPLRSYPVSMELELDGRPCAVLVSRAEAGGSPRIRYHSGVRLVDWEGEQWVSYEREGVRWYQDELTDTDYRLLYALLAPDLLDLLRDGEGGGSPRS
jgi:hypothetical protein